MPLGRVGRDGALQLESVSVVMTGIVVVVVVV